MTSDYPRPRPRPTQVSKPFWDACRQHRLIVQRCNTCGAHVFVPRTFCEHCLGTGLEWVPVSGKGFVVTFTVVWRAQTPAFETPYVVAVVRLDEGCEMMTNLVDVEPTAVKPGARVEVKFVPISDDVILPCFTSLGAMDSAVPVTATEV
jgi:uncharacterized protein